MRWSPTVAVGIVVQILEHDIAYLHVLWYNIIVYIYTSIIIIILGWISVIIAIAGYNLLHNCT